MTTPNEILTSEPRSVTKSCTECQRPFAIDLDVFSEFLAAIVKVCPECSERHAVEDQRAQVIRAASTRNAAWEKLCPFTNTTRDRLPFLEKLTEVMGWKFCGHGLILHGPTGGGKSRCAWLLMEREFKAGKSVSCLGAKAAIEYASTYSQSASDVEKWMNLHSGVDILLLDDVFKSKLTDSFEMAVFTIVTLRTERNRPIILTSNDTPTSLMSRMSPDRAAPLMRRLVEHCHVVSFPQPPAPRQRRLPHNND
jgi:DNA replication protein DnaC